ncbi:MAG TPA: UvrD-helicase domain-containing protein [Candidatus Gracilibacteria bacterium]
MRDQIPLTASLNPEQKKAAEVLSGPLLILAGAGSGKTRVLTHRIAYLMQNGIPGHKILAVTFTNKAAKEMKSRVEQLLESETGLLKDRSQRMTFPLLGTFHSICVRMLRDDIAALDQGYNRNFVIFDSDDSERVVKLIFQELEIDPKDLKPRAIRTAISGLKNQLVKSRDVLSALGDSRFAKAVEAIYPRYQKKLLEHNALDFDDLLGKTVELLEKDKKVLEKYQQKWEHVLVDEYQDTNFAQYRLIRLLVENHQNLCVVGDDHQSIYSFRGADYRNILEFEKDFPLATVVKLEQNYRSTKSILNNANTLIGYNRSGRKKNLWTENPEGEKLQIHEVWDEKEEGNVIARKIQELAARDMGHGVRADAHTPYSDIAILYRMNAQSRAIEEALMRSEIPYQIIGGTRFFDRKEIKDILAYLRLIFNPRDDIAFLRIINVPARKIGPSTLETLKNYANEYQIGLYDVLEEVEGIPELAESKKLHLKAFYEMMEGLRDKAQNPSIMVLIQSVIDDVDYMKYLDDGSSEGEARQQNVRELLSVATRYEGIDDSLETFLEGVALVSDIDQKDDNTDSVTLMTVHASKGLEFPIVFLPGWEDGVFPGSQSQLDGKSLEEERRLGYVAITRAEKECFILHTRQRMLFGRTEYSIPSKFLSELDEKSCVRTGMQGQNKVRTYQKSGLKSSERTKGFTFDHPLNRVPKTKEEAVFGRAANETAYTVGQRIRHSSFGEGTIIQIQGDVLSVAFKGEGIKKIVASSSPIEAL